MADRELRPPRRGARDGKYFKSRDRYYVVQSLQFMRGGPNSDLGAVVLDVTDLPDPASAREVARIRELGGGPEESRSGYHDLYVGYHPDSDQDRFYGGGTGGYFVNDVTDLESPTQLTGIRGISRGHTFTPTPDGRYVVAESEYQYAPLRIFDPRTVAYSDTYLGTLNQANPCVMRGAFGVDVRNEDGLIVVSDATTGLWTFRMDSFQGWNGESWGMPDVSSARKWDVPLRRPISQ